MDQNSYKPRDFIYQTSEDTKHDTDDGRPKSPLRSNARTDSPEAEEKEDLGERNKIPEQDNQEDGPDHKILENMSEENQLLTDKIPMKSEGGKILSNPSNDNRTMGQGRFKESDKDNDEEPPRDMSEEDLNVLERSKSRKQISEGEEELPEENVFKEDLEIYSILEQYYEENGNPSNIQTQENPDHQPALPENQLLIGKMTPIKSEPERILSSSSVDNETTKQESFKLSTKVSKVEEELPEENEIEDLGGNCKIPEQNYEELLRSNTLKDEELKTERKQNEEQIRNLQTKYEECEKLKKKVTELKRGKKNVKECEKLRKEVKKLKGEKASSDKDVKKIEELEDEKAILEDKNAELKDKNAKLEKECKSLKISKACLDKGKPCGRCHKCLATFKKEWPLVKRT